MYDIIESIIGHTWNTNYTGDQQYIYYCCIVLICVTFCVIVDLIYRIFRHFWHS